MSVTSMHTQHPTTARLVKATIAAAVAAGLILITTVLPAEYGIDPTGIGGKLGLGVLAADRETAPVVSPAQPANQSTTTTFSPADHAQIAAKAVEAFGANAGQNFNAAAVSLRPTPYRNDTMSVTLEPGKGAEVKALLKAGDGIVFHWSATGDVALDMHGERPDAKGTWTSYAVERAQRAASGTFVAPFDGSHGWYWQNRGDKAVTVNLQIAGHQEKLYRP